jgi:HPt (histidine-containing phosphotransfer) domain-containing protein
MLKGAAKSLSAPALSDYAKKNEAAASAVDSEQWADQRKEMREEQYQNRTQQSY